jgi:hypothetical protein
MQDLSIEDEDPPETLSGDSDVTIDEENNSSIDYGQNYPSSPDVSIDFSKVMPSSPDISVCETERVQDHKPFKTQVSTPQFLKSNLLRRRLQISPVLTPAKPSNLRMELEIGWNDSEIVESDLLNSLIASKVTEEQSLTLSRQERVYVSIIAALQDQKREKQNQIHAKLKECEIAISQLHNAQLKYKEFESFQQKQFDEYQEMRQRLWDIQTQINFAKQGVQSSILLNQQIFEECVHVSKQLEETRMTVDQKILLFQDMIDHHNPKSFERKLRYHWHIVSENFVFFFLYAVILLGIRYILHV